MSKTALVTGGSGGIGGAICTDLAAKGYRIISTYPRDGTKARNWQAKQDYEIQLYPCNIGSYESCVALKEAIVKDSLQVDVLVNNAGITRDAKFVRMTPEQWREVISTNLDSMFNMCHQFVGDMTERGFGRIINISSINGQKGQAGQTNYSAAKAGVHGFGMALAQEVARKGVTVNTVSPGYIGTDMVMSIREDIRNMIIDGVPMKRLGTPQEIAALVGFLASDDAGFITGANFAANGGQHMH